MPEIRNVRVPEDVVSKTVHGEEVILDLLKGHYFGLNDMGTTIWQSLKEGKKVSEIYTQISNEFDVDEETFQNDLNEWLTQLKAKGLVEFKN